MVREFKRLQAEKAKEQENAEEGQAHMAPPSSPHHPHPQHQQQQASSPYAHMGSTVSGGPRGGRPKLRSEL
jgi:hypothetical protein